MKFYSLNQLSSILGESFQFEKIDTYLTTIIDSDIHNYLVHLKQPNAALFVGWIENWNELANILNRSKSIQAYTDFLKIEKHQLFHSFQQFLTPLLICSLSKLLEDNELNKNLVFIKLATGDERTRLESSIYLRIEEKFQAVDALQLQESPNETQLIDAVQLVINDDIIVIIQALSKQSYVLLVGYVEHCFKILNSKGCSLRLANWMVKQLQQLTLNPTHQEQLDQLKTAIKTGGFQLDSGKKTIKTPLKQLLINTSVVFVLAFVGWIVFFKPFSKNGDDLDKLKETSSYTSFTVEERKHIDSLIRLIQSEPTPVYISEPSSTEGWEELFVENTKVFKNNGVNDFYKHWYSYLSQDTTLSQGTCKQLTKKINQKNLPDNFLALTAKKDGKIAVFMNDADYDVQLIVFQNTSTNKPFYHELKKGEQVECHLTDGDYVGLVVGKYAIPYQKDDKKSIVFCEIDNTTLKSLSTFYSVQSNKSFNYKFLIYGNTVNDFQLIDMYGVLKVHQ
ncbi:MAG: hypothetical protein M9916_12590 [Crocinitomicaceae bacterium]|nr:hypothetical protein [Crocinitomicaceae bacterium]